MALPKNVEIPKGEGQFMKFQEGNNKVRILSDVITGWEGWKGSKPFRHEGDVCKISADQVDTNKYGNPAINYFWAMVVWDYIAKKVQVLEITQKKVMEALYAYEISEDWGDLKGYDVNIIRTNGDKVSYSVQAIPPKPLANEIRQAYEESKVDLKALFKGEYPMPRENVDISDTDDIPFDL